MQALLHRVEAASALVQVNGVVGGEAEVAEEEHVGGDEVGGEVTSGEAEAAQLRMLGVERSEIPISTTYVLALAPW